MNSMQVGVAGGAARGAVIAGRHGAAFRAAFFGLVLSLVVTLGWPVAARAQCEAAAWLLIGETPGVNGVVEAMTWWDPDGPGPRSQELVIAGNFSRGGSARGAVLRWDGERWRALGTGLFGTVSALAVLPDGRLVAGGTFELIFGSVAVLNGEVWERLGPLSHSSPVRDFCVLPNGDLVSVGLRELKRWNGTSWSFISNVSFLNSTLHEAIALPNGDLVVAGSFSHVGSLRVNGVARWNGTTWSSFGNGLGSVYALALMPNGDIVAGGWFNNVTAGRGISRWNGTAWTNLGTGIGTSSSPGSVYSISVSQSGDVIATGDFSTAGGVAIGPIARWSNGEWQAVAPNRRGPGFGFVVEHSPQGELFLGGDFRATFFEKPTLALHNIVRLTEEGMWAPVGDGLGDFSGWGSAQVHALELLDSGDLAAGGRLKSTGTSQLSGVARWSGGGALSRFGALFGFGGLESEVNSVLQLRNGEVLVAGRQMSSTNSLRLLCWNGQAWRSLGTGFPEQPAENIMRAMVEMPNGDIIVGGRISDAAGIPVSNIARWNGVAWSSLGAGLNGEVHTILVRPDGSIVAGGAFTASGAVPMQNIGRWDGQSWQPLGAGVDQLVRALVNLPNGDLVAGGAFNSAGGQTASRVARWDGSSWSSVGGALEALSQPGFADVRALALRENGELIIGGWWLQPEGSPTAHSILRLVEGGWVPLDPIPGQQPRGWLSPTVSGVNALKVLPNGDIAAGGGDLAIYAFPSSGPEVLVPPSSRAACPGKVARMAVSPRGRFPLQTAWQFRVTGATSWAEVVEGANVAPVSGEVLFVAGGASSRLLDVSQAPAGSLEFRAVITNACGSVTSDVATLTVLGADDPLCSRCNYDYNRDQVVDLIDAQLMAQVFVGLLAPESNWLDGDLNGDENADLTDAQLLAVFVVSGTCGV